MTAGGGEVSGVRQRRRARERYKSVGAGLVAAVLAGSLPAIGISGFAGSAASQDRPAAGKARDVWPGQAAPDADVAREGRGILPFTREQIEKLARLLEQTREATARGAGRPVNGRLRRIHIDADAIPAIRVRRGYTTVVGFSDLTGAPWPIEEALVERRFLPDDDAGPAGHLLYLAPRQPFMTGNLTVKLRGLADPVVAMLRGGGETADFRVDLRLALAGPNVDPAALAKPEAFRAGDASLVSVLTGVIPAGARRLNVTGGVPGDRAWRLGEDILLITRADVLSPGPWAAERGSAGRWAYRLPDTPLALVSAGGRERRLAFARAAVETDRWEAGNER